MAFWGVEVKPGKPYTHRYDETRGRLRVSQATLGNVVGAEKTKPAAKTTVQCNVGDKSPVLICSLFANSSETCHLELEFEEQEVVIFSVLGQRSVHVSGYFVVPRGAYDGNEEPHGEDIAETESEDSDYDDFSAEDEYESDFIDDDDDIDMYAPSRPRRSGVVIEEIIDEEKPSDGDQSRSAKKKNCQVSDSDDAADESQLAVVTLSTQPDSEDEDGFPISKSKKTEGKEKKKRKIDDSAPMDDEKMGEGKEAAKKKKKKLDKKNKKKEKGEKGNLSGANTEDEAEVKAPNDGENQTMENKEESAKGDAVQEGTPASKKMSDNENGESGDANQKQSKKKKKKKNKNSGEKDSGKKEGKEENSQPQQSRTFGNGLVVEEISMGRPDGKKAAPGSKVSVNYIGKLQNGKIFDSNVGQRPFKFRLGVGQVIKGWDVGVSGMRVGDKRRLTIPPAMGYGDKAVGKIPKNSWLIFDVELANVQ